MSISLHKTTKNNWVDLIELTVFPEQENFLESNLRSIARSRFEPTWVPFSIYFKEIAVGFLMYDSRDYYIIRFMIDRHFQNQNYGRVGLELLLEYLKTERKFPEATVSFVSGNIVAEKVYEKVGFRRTGRIEGTEVYMKIILSINILLLLR